MSESFKTGFLLGDEHWSLKAPQFEMLSGLIAS